MPQLEVARRVGLVVAAMVAMRGLLLAFQVAVKRKKERFSHALFGSGRSTYFLCNGESAARLASVLEEADATDLHVIFDFDRTLTCADSSQCHDGLLRVKDDALAAALAPYWRFSDEGGPPPIRGRPMRAWWDDVHGLLATHRVSEGALAEAEAARPAAFRPGAVEALRELERLRVPTLVVSAGLEHVIRSALEGAGFSATNALEDDLADAESPTSFRILANRLEYDAARIVVGAFPDEPVHSGNKKDAYARLAPYFAASGDAATRRVLVVGDSVGDASVGDDVPKRRGPAPFAKRERKSRTHCYRPRRRCGVAVGFFDPANPWGKRAAFEAAFDALLPANEDLHWLADALRNMTSARPGVRQQP